MDISTDALRRHRLTKSGLVTPFSSPVECAERLIGVQSQISQAAALAIANRVKGFSFGEYQRLLYRERSLVRTWGQRHTMHVYASRDWGNLADLFRVRRSWAHAGLIKDGGTEREFETLLARLKELIADGGCFSRSEITAHIGVKVSSWGGFLIDAAYLGLLCDSGENTFSSVLEWNRSASIPSSDVCGARRNLVRRYLRTYGPATHTDIANWLADKAGDVKLALAELDVDEITCEGRRLLVLREDLDAVEASASGGVEELPVIMLYRFDPLLLAYRDKSWIVPIRHFDRVWIAGGHINGVILVKGRAVGTWKYVRKGTGFHIETDLFSGRKIGASLRKIIARREKFLGEFFRNSDEKEA